MVCGVRWNVKANKKLNSGMVIVCILIMVIAHCIISYNCIPKAGIYFIICFVYVIYVIYTYIYNVYIYVSFTPIKMSGKTTKKIKT